MNEVSGSDDPQEMDERAVRWVDTWAKFARAALSAHGDPDKAAVDADRMMHLAYDRLQQFRSGRDPTIEAK